MILKLDDLPVRVAFCDPAGQRKGMLKTSARAAIACIAADQFRRIFALHLWAKRCTTRELIDHMYYVQQHFRPSIFGVESNAMQELFANATEIIARHEGVKLPLLPVEQTNRLDKDARIRFNLQSPFSYGQIFLQANQDDAISEIVGFPKALTKDLIDALASAVSLLPARVMQHQAYDRLTAVRQYLEKCQVPPWQVEQRLADIRKEMRTVYARPEYT